MKNIGNYLTDCIEVYADMNILEANTNNIGIMVSHFVNYHRKYQCLGSEVMQILPKLLVNSIEKFIFVTY